MAEEFYYVLYSETRKVAYIYDRPFDKFWSKYIMNKYPKDKWLEFKDNMFIHYEIMSRADKIRLIDRGDIRGRKLHIEIIDAMESLATRKIEEYTFVVNKENPRGGETSIYIGHSFIDAREAFQTNRGTECIDVWKDGRFIDSFHDTSSFEQKYGKLIS